jgi:CBS domain-containing protein
MDWAGDLAEALDVYAAEEKDEPMPKTAADVMERSVVVLSPETSLLDAHRVFVEEEIHGAPVVDDEGRVVGVVSSTDLLRAVSEEHESAGFASNPVFRETREFGPSIWTVPEDFQDRLTNRTVGEVMTDGAFTVEETTRARAVAELMHRERIHRVWVVKGGRPTGVVSTLDLLPLVRDEQ